MVTATYIFNEEKVIAAGKTVEEMMAPIRQMLLENGAEEIAPGVFCKDGFYAMDVIDLPLIGKFGVSSSQNKKAAIDDAVDHAVSLIENYLKEHPEVKIEESFDGLDFELVEKKPGVYALHVK